ncbi:hypothetical protein [Marinoscillum luteum]|uniref:DUF4178 domain-containing protein n=1 Tax=Marinoscillum luteum TaxID=861051 RepID=A0ABW7N7G3_9BACT
MGKIPAILLLCVLSIPFMGTYTWLRVEKYQLKRQIKRQLIAQTDKNDLILLKIAHKDSSLLSWEHSKEFEYKGEMYDVVERYQNEDTTYYRCWWDHEETRLNRQLQVLVNKAFGKDPYHEANRERVETFTSGLICVPIPVFKFITFVSAFQRQALEMTPIYRQQKPPLPPPQQS